jgi:hypothetical protein
MTDDTILPFSFPAVHAKKVTAAFDGGRLTSNGGVMLLAMAERRLGLADKLAQGVPGSARSDAGRAQPCPVSKACSPVDGEADAKPIICVYGVRAVRLHDIGGKAKGQSLDD